MKAKRIEAVILVMKNKATTEKKENTRPIPRAVLAEIFPDGIGLNFVLSIFESIILSNHIFKIADPDAPIAIRIRATPLINKLLSEGASNIAHKAVNITKEITPGLIKTYNCFKKFTT